MVDIITGMLCRYSGVAWGIRGVRTAQGGHFGGGCGMAANTIISLFSRDLEILFGEMVVFPNG